MFGNIFNYFIHKSIRCICKKSKSVLFTIASPGKQEPCLITPTFSIISNKICIAMSRASESIQSNRGASYHLYPIASGLNPQLAYAKLASFKKFLLSINQQIYRWSCQDKKNRNACWPNMERMTKMSINKINKNHVLTV